MAALPTGINAYLFAARYDAAVPEATSTILLSTLVSAVTLGAFLLAALRTLTDPPRGQRVGTGVSPR